MNLTKKGIIRDRIIRFFFALSAVCIAGNADAQPPTVADIVAGQGCAMPHCTQGLTDNTGLSAAWSGGVVDFWRDRGVSGSFIGLGCVANSSTAVCSFRSSSSKPVEVRAYTIDGTPLWSSTAFGKNAHYSSPIIGPDGGVIAADATKLIRFGPDGAQIWSHSTAGSQVRPNVTDDGHIILATAGGPILAYDFVTGELVAQLRLEGTIRSGRRTLRGYFDSINNSAIKGNRVYISTRFTYGSLPTKYGRLYALDLLQENGAYHFEIAWYYEFQAPSGTSPTLSVDEEGNTLIYFDGTGVTPSSAAQPVALAIRDLGNSGELLWAYPLPTLPQSSPAIDPRGGIWYYAFGSSELFRIDSNGNNIQTIDVNDIVDDLTATFRPYSVMTISKDVDSGNPVMIVSATTSNESITYIVAIDLESESLLWQYRIDEGRGSSGGTSGQYAMLINDQDEPILVFSTRTNGVWGLVVGSQPQPQTYYRDTDEDGYGTK
jgi:hypothetical protein